MLRKRQEHIIDILNNNNSWMTGKDMSNILSVSDRTIRLDISTINKFYNCLLIQSNKRFGYKINKDLLHKQDIKTKDVIPETSHERCVYIIQELLFKNKEINLISLQEKVFVSGYSIDNDIKKIRKMINEYSTLKLIRSKSHIRLSGNESDKRSLYKQLLTEETEGNFMNLNAIANLWNNFDLLEIKDILEDVCHKHDYKIRKINFPMIMIHTGIAIERIINNNFINSVSSYEKLKESKEYKISRDFFIFVSRRINIKLVEEEISLFAFILMGEKSTEYRKDLIKEELAKEANELINKVIMEIKEHFDIDFSNDKDLKVGLFMHLQSLLERKRNSAKITNLYLQEIKRKYPLVFEMAVRIGSVIYEVSDIYIDENELAFLALHLGAAYERANIIKKYRVIMIMPYGQILSKMCIDKLENRFNDRIEIIVVHSFFENNMILEDDPDLIITTVPLKHNLKIPTVTITVFVNYEDESKVFQVLNSLDKTRNNGKFVNLVKVLMKKDLFYVKESMKSSNEIIEFLCDELISKGLATEEYKVEVLKREAISATSFVYGFAVPHSVVFTSNESCISTMILNTPIKWGEYEVKLIILLAIRETDNHLLKVFFHWLSSLVTDQNKFRQLLEINSHEDLIKQIIS
ncbi:BglG family transcription antiterminator [Clostridium tarantellae]|uniref:PRD domain-containing protein n=1 Tax=Clostridium tarantellae TaxID=39493 RepID=A0A6I1MLE6_9CLOT|nr:PRD domain-containing protein [Clostridium tarantellae]MPQ42937.1 PRD domain-containing protein [Clostridium tarantellae]